MYSVNVQSWFDYTLAKSISQIILACEVSIANTHPYLLNSGVDVCPHTKLLPFLFIP